MKIILRENFTPEQEKLAESLKSELLDACHELEEFSHVVVYGLKTELEWQEESKEEIYNTSVLLEIDYSDPEKDKKITIFNSY